MAPEPAGLLVQPAAVTVPRVKFEFTTFPPRTAELLTGMSGAYQRELRKRGVMPVQGYLRYDLFAVALMLVLRLLAERGGPAAAMPLAERAALGVVWNLLGWRDTYSGDHDATLKWDATLAPKIEEWQATTALLRHKRDWSRDEAYAEMRRADATLGGFNAWTLQADWLRRELLRRHRDDSETVPRFACQWANGAVTWAQSIDTAFNAGAPGDPRLVGPVMAIDQERLAELLLGRLRSTTATAFVNVRFNRGKFQ